MAKWMTESSSKWTPKTMREFIQAQNNYSYDGGAPVKHSAEALARFADIEGSQLDKFKRVYDKLYANELIKDLRRFRVEVYGCLEGSNQEVHLYGKDNLTKAQALALCQQETNRCEIYLETE